MIKQSIHAGGFKRLPETAMKVKGVWRIDHIRKGCVIDREVVDNIVVNQGLDHILGVEFASVSPIGLWYIGLYKGNYAPVATDTAATFTGNAQESQTYGQGRIQFQALEANQNANNSASPALFTFIAGDTIFGAFLTSSQAVGSTQGILFSAVAFGTARTVIANDQLSIQYGIAAASG